jgi:hypothetical protein
LSACFALGSLAFAAASIASQWASAPRSWIGVAFFAGSLFFTAGAGAQYRQAAAAERARPRQEGPLHRLRPASWAPGAADQPAAIIQLAGTLFFNVSTFQAMKHGLTAEQENLRVWTPDVIGSICFLVSSQLAFAAICGCWLCVRRRLRDWRIAALNLVGSVAFGASAVAALVVPASDEPVDAAVANATTTLGALCFLAGALLQGSGASRAQPGGPGRPSSSTSDTTKSAPATAISP